MAARTSFGRSFLVISVLLGLAGCAATHGDPGELWAPGTETGSPPIVTPGAVPASLEGCLEAGGELLELDSVSNNDREDHGELLTFGISPEGLLAAAGADGTLKFWTLDAELLATVDGSALVYGVEAGRTPITDLAFYEEAAIVGDVRGLVSHMDAEGAFWPVGGTTPDVPIRSVAVHAATARYAHAQVGPDLVPLVVRAIPGTEGDGEVFEIEPTIVTEPNDLAFAPGGELVVVGGPMAEIEIHDAADPRTVLRSVGFHGSVPIREVALSARGGVGVAVSEDYLYVLRELEAWREIWIPEHQGRSVDVTPGGAVAFSVGADGMLLSHWTEDGSEAARAPVADPITVRVDPSGALVIVGSRDATIHVFGCTAP